MTKLPNLPQVKAKKEALNTPKIQKWVQSHWHTSYGLELKIKGNKLRPNQIRALERIKQGRFSKKESDSAIGTMTVDVIGLVNADALVGIYDPATKKWSIQDYATGEVLHTGI